MSSKGLDFVARHEALPGGQPALKVYKDSAGHPTIGYGHKIKRGEDFSKGITKEQALKLLRRDVQIAVDTVNTSVKVPLSQAQFDALVSLAFNIGSPRFQKSTLVRDLNNGRLVPRPDFTRLDTAHHVVSRGLLKRREDEYSLFSTRGRSER